MRVGLGQGLEANRDRWLIEFVVRLQRGREFGGRLQEEFEGGSRMVFVERDVLLSLLAVGEAASLKQ